MQRLLGAAELKAPTVEAEPAGEAASGCGAAVHRSRRRGRQQRQAAAPAVVQQQVMELELEAAGRSKLREQAAAASSPVQTLCTGCMRSTVLEHRAEFLGSCMVIEASLEAARGKDRTKLREALGKTQAQVQGLGDMLRKLDAGGQLCGCCI